MILSEELQQPLLFSEDIKIKNRILQLSTTVSNLFERPYPIHFTSSPFVLNEKRDKVLMVYHLIYDSWSWPGGHADGEKDLLQVAKKELEEETGLLEYKPLIDQCVSIDVLPVLPHQKRGELISAHEHLNTCYLFKGRENSPLRPKLDENKKVMWIPVKELNLFVTESHMLPIYNKILHRIQQLHIS